MAEEKLKFSIDPNIYGLTGFNAVHNPDLKDWIFLLTSGNQVRRFLVTPIHAKRILLLLQQRMAEYEKKFGEIHTSLPKKGISKNQGIEGFVPKG